MNNIRYLLCTQWGLGYLQGSSFHVDKVRQIQMIHLDGLYWNQGIYSSNQGHTGLQNSKDQARNMKDCDSKQIETKQIWLAAK